MDRLMEELQTYDRFPPPTPLPGRQRQSFRRPLSANGETADENALGHVLARLLFPLRQIICHIDTSDGDTR